MVIVKDRVRTSEIEMEYFRFGTGDKTLVILPGLSVKNVIDAAEAVAEEYKSMAGEFTAYVFERRRELPAEYPIRAMALDTAEAIKTLGLRDIYLFGASQGGMLALVIAIEFPELVKKLALGSTTSNVTDERYEKVEKWIQLAEKRDGVGLYLGFGRDVYPPEIFEQSRELLASIGVSVTEEEFERFIILAKGTKGFYVTDELGKIQCPVLAIGVFEDEVLDSDATMEIAEKLDHRPDFRLYMYIGYGHAAYDTAPDYRDRLLRFFLRK